MIILDQLTKNTSPAQTQRDGSEQLRIYIMCVRNDYDAVKPIENYLNKDFTAELPTDRKQDHRDMLADCDAALIYCGSGSDEWIKEKLRDIRRSRGWGRQKPEPIQAMVGPQVSRIRKQYQDDDNLLFCGFESFSPQALDPFLVKISALERIRP